MARKANSVSNRMAHQEQTRIVLRPIASGMPLGFFSFGIGMLMLAMAALNVIPLHEAKEIGLVMVLSVFPMELIAAIFAFLARDSMSTATLGLFSVSWLTLGFFDIVTKPGAQSVALGIYAFGFAGAIFLLALLAIHSKPFFTVLLSVATIRAVLSGMYDVGGGHELLKISGYFALALMALAFYGGVAFALEDTKQKPVLPLFRRGAADEAFGGYNKQLGRLEAEPGIRQQL
jgi:succinate-acetate transporter protein